MVDVTIGAAGVIPPAEVKDVELYHPKSWVTKYVFCQDAKVIAIQYSITALSIGLVALVLSWLIRLQLAFPSSFSAIAPGDYLQFITMHGMIMVIYLLTALFLGGFGNYLIPLMVGARDMVFPYVNMISYWVYLLAVLVLVASFFMPAVVEMGQHLKYRGGSPLLFQHLFWFFGHPEVYIVALPAFGIVSDLISTHARKNIFGYRMMVWAIVAIGALSLVVWAHHMYVSGMNPYFGFFFATTTLIIAIPTAIKVYNWVLTLWRGDIHLTVPMLFALSFIVTFVNGGMTGLFLGNVVVDVPLSDTMFVVAHFHVVMGMAPIFVIFGAIYHWYPKVTGRMMNEPLGKFHFWVTFLGAYLIYFPMHYLGLLGVPRRYFEMGDMAFVPQSATTLNGFITAAALIVGFAQMVFLFNMIWSLFNGKPAGSNPWRATTLEWQTPETPPGHGNWGKELPVVYRWAYGYSVPGAKEDFVPQNQPPVSRAA